MKGKINKSEPYIKNELWKMNTQNTYSSQEKEAQENSTGLCNSFETVTTPGKLLIKKMQLRLKQRNRLLISERNYC